MAESFVAVAKVDELLPGTLACVRVGEEEIAIARIGDEFYATQNAQLCWNTHGSGLAGVRGISPKDFPAISALGFRACARFALITAELILRHFGLWDDRVEREFAEHGAERVLTKYAMLTKNRTG